MYQWKVVPFGLNIAPNSFSRMMAIAFSGVPLSTAILYMDDLIVPGKSEKDQTKNLRKVFEICRKTNLKINPDKCQFFKAEVTYLGHRCTNIGILPDNSKLAAVANYPRPVDGEATKRFVAFANYYRRFVKNFAQLAQPLNKLTRKKATFEWTPECQKSFDRLRQSLSNPPVLAYPDYALPFHITVDASKLACGAVLSQYVNDHEHPIYYA